LSFRPAAAGNGEKMNFRPCIDLHNGIVKQIVGSSLSDDDENLETNFEAEKPSSWYAELYRQYNLKGGHIIQLGPGNETAAKNALQAWPGGMQIGGGITIDNAAFWLDNGASAVIVTSWVFHDGKIDMERLRRLSRVTGKERLVLDLSCRKKDGGYKVVTNRWQSFTDEYVTPELLDLLASYCCEFLVHAVDVEGKCSGIESSLVSQLGAWGKKPVTYAGGISTEADIEKIETLGRGNIDFTVGSSLDIFGGKGLCFESLAEKYSS
jgi:phosphoribosylformimino-5-aminoimidazole carboxamide ribotide isomerase